MNKYSPELKIKIAREYLDTHTTYVELAEKYNIANTSYVGLWVRQLKDNGEARIRSKKRLDIVRLLKRKLLHICMIIIFHLLRHHYILALVIQP